MLFLYHTSNGEDPIWFSNKVAIWRKKGLCFCDAVETSCRYLPILSSRSSEINADAKTKTAWQHRTSCRWSCRRTTRTDYSSLENLATKFSDPESTSSRIRRTDIISLWDSFSSNASNHLPNCINNFPRIGWRNRMKCLWRCSRITAVSSRDTWFAYENENSWPSSVLERKYLRSRKLKKMIRFHVSPFSCLRIHLSWCTWNTV